jgi:hypothetical protein
MQCEDARNQFTDFITGELNEPQLSMMSQHLAGCDACRAEAEDQKTLWMTLGAIPTGAPSPDARSRFDAMLAVYREGLTSSPDQGRWNAVNSWIGRWRPVQPALQLGVAAAMLLLGLTAGLQLRQAPAASTAPIAQADSDIAELRIELLQMRQMLALSLMQQQSASERLRGVNWSYQLQQPGGELLSALLDALMRDPNVNVRLAAVDALRQFSDQPGVRRGVIEALSRTESPMVQVALIDLAVDLRERESIDTLRRITDDRAFDAAVRERARRGITELGY